VTIGGDTHVWGARIKRLPIIIITSKNTKQIFKISKLQATTEKELATTIYGTLKD